MISSDQQCVILGAMHSSDLFLAGSNHQHGGGGIYVCGGSGKSRIVHTDLKNVTTPALAHRKKPLLSGRR